MTAPGSERSGVRLADLVAAFSLATDLGLGQPMEHVLRSWLIAARLGDRLGLPEEERASLFYVASLAWVGCVADTPEIAQWFGDDIAYRRDTYAVDLAGLPMMWFLLRHVGSGSPGLQRLRLAATLVVTGGREVERTIMSHCLNTAQLASVLGLSTPIQEQLKLVFTRWDAKGVPAGIGGTDIPLPVRLFHLADIVAAFHRADGVDRSVAVARDRSGKAFDPGIAEVFARAAPDILAGLDDQDWQAAIDDEPGLQEQLTHDELDRALEAVADFTDLRSTFLAGHSRGVSRLAADAACVAGLPEATVTAVRRAGLVHDLGRHGVPATVWDKPGPLSASELERVRLHAYYTERMLARPAVLAALAPIAAAHHERMDGSGYHRGLAGPSIAAPARLLAAADVYHAMTEPRAHRPALEPARAAAELRAEGRSGRLEPSAVDAVLQAAGQRTGRRRAGPAGLTPREVEVLTLIARGASNRHVARTLGITPRTAGTHIERIYVKIGASTRATATLFALQHGLLDTLEPLGS